LLDGPATHCAADGADGTEHDVRPPGLQPGDAHRHHHDLGAEERAAHDAFCGARDGAGVFFGLLRVGLGGRQRPQARTGNHRPDDQPPKALKLDPHRSPLEKPAQSWRANL
jgi:hypothetical protein